MIVSCPRTGRKGVISITPRAESSTAVTGAWMRLLDWSKHHCGAFSRVWVLPKASFQEIDSFLSYDICEGHRHVNLMLGA